ncbi:hypothetical protein NGM37_13505, partial [Streptomyces sp. TRM76130]|nr:hypothetical protein [Streptomyces sp. TRM76130]
MTGDGTDRRPRARAPATGFHITCPLVAVPASAVTPSAPPAAGSPPPAAPPEQQGAAGADAAQSR